MRFTSASFETSPTAASACPPRRSIIAAVSLAALASMSATTTEAPSFAKRSAPSRARARDAILDPQRRPLAARAEAGGAVVERPGDARRRERPGLVALVGVDVGRVEPRQLARARHLPGHPLAEERRAVGLALLVEQVPPPGLVPQARVEVEARARLAHVVFRHEGDADALRVRDLLGAVLVDDVVVGGGHGLAVVQVDLLLPGAPLALARLDRDAGAH